MWSNVVTLFREYMGTGLVVIFYLVSVLFLSYCCYYFLTRCLRQWYTKRQGMKFIIGFCGCFP